MSATNRGKPFNGELKIIISKSKAVSLGLKRYFTGIPARENIIKSNKFDDGLCGTAWE